MQYGAYLHNMDLSERFRVLGEPLRLRMLRVILSANFELCACEIMDALALPQYAVSRHLKALVRAGLVSERRERRLMLYGPLAKDPVNQALYAAVLAISPAGFASLTEDARLLDERLALREKGVCVVTYEKKPTACCAKSAKKTMPRKAS